jgi:hypothetical protein
MVDSATPWAVCAVMAGKAHMLKIGVSLGLLLGTVFVSCAVAWTRFGEYVGQNGWWWLAGGVVVGLGLGELVFRIRPSRRGNARPARLPAPSRPVLFALVAVAATVALVSAVLTASSAT